MKNIFRSVLLPVAAFVLCVGCTADPDVAGWDSFSNRGSSMKFNIVFEPLTGIEMATRATDAPAGDAINDIEDLCVLLFDKDSEELVDNGIREVKHADLTFIDNPKYETDREATFELEGIPYGEYYMFAVANLGKKVKTETFAETVSTYEVLDGLRAENKLTTVADLKAIRLTWDPEQIANNAEMLGYFTAGEVPGTPAALDGKTPTVVIDRDNMTLHSWLRRAASKVTIEFDPSGLRNNVRVYLKSARLKHIPSHCPLGDRNEPKDPAADLIPDENTPYYHIDYYPDGAAEASDHDSWMVLTRSGVLDGALNIPKPEYEGMHTPTAKALYFYENLQGEGKDKSQDFDQDGELDYPGKNTDPNDPGYMDKKPCGTYIEIEGHYVSNAPGNYTQGRIFYRFMLGKDAVKDYNAERNHHYKLTLKFRGNANDVDWHIDYMPESDVLYAPAPYYISYLYNQTMDLPLYISGKILTGDNDKDYVKLEIVKNGWGPSDEAVFKAMYPFPLYNTAKDPVCNGFLSLKPGNPNGVLEPPPGYEKGTLRDTDFNKTHWEKEGLGVKEISGKELKEAIDRDGVVNVPLYTREKQLVATTAFTGNNIYPQYRREAIVELTGVIGGVEIPKKEIQIIQMRRIINPAGVFRTSKNTLPFKIIMSYRTSPSADTFYPLHSIGPWRAQITAGEGWMIEGATDGVISGDDGSEISFSVKPEGAIDENDTRCAYLDVSYNNYTCHHRVILRQGDAPLALLAGESEWYYYNLRTRDDLADKPIDEGSMFRYGNLDEPISSENQSSDRVGQHTVSLKIEGGGEMEWTKMKGSSNASGFSNDTVLNGEAEVAKYEDYAILYTNDDIQYKYGILYGDEALETDMSFDKSCGYNYHNNSKALGMRGLFVYNEKDARSLFFPVGCTGMGRRKDNGFYEKDDNNFQRRCVLRYAQRSGENKNRWAATATTTPTAEQAKNALANNAPLFYYIHEFEGAIYWLNKEETYTHRANPLNSKTNAWDINFRTLDFNDFAKNATEGSQVDAGFIRCVKKKSTETK